MASNTISSLAILAVNWEDRNIGYLDNFVPFLAESIRRNGSEVISVNDVQKTVLTEFGLRLPINTIRGLLPTLRKQGYIRLQPQGSNIYTPNWVKLQEFNFKQTQQDMVR